MSELTDDQIQLRNSDITDEFEMSFGSLLKEKNTLTSEVRQAGISQSDEDLINSFTETMTDNSTTLDEFIPDDSEITDQLEKMKAKNAELFKQVHPEEYKR